MRRWWDTYREPIRLRVLTESTGLPVSYAEAKAHLHLTEDSQQATVEAQLAAARVHLEAVTGRRFLKTRVRQTFDCFPWGGVMELGASPILPASLLSTGEDQVVIRYFTAGSTGSVWSSTNFILSRDSDPPRIALERDQEFPQVELRNADGVEVDYWVGYGLDSTDAPKWQKMSMLLTLGHWFLNRESVVTGSIATKVPESARAIVAPHRSPLVRV